MTDTVVQPSPDGRIDCLNFIAELRRAVPTFTPDEISEGLTYLTANDLIRFIQSYAPLANGLEIGLAFRFFEKALADGDQEVHNVVWDAFEGLSNDEFKLYGHLLGPLSTKLANRIIADRR